MSDADELRVSDEDRRLYSGWTEVDGDLEGCDPVIARAVLGTRLEFAGTDGMRARNWLVPDGVDCINDMAYVDDGLRAHRLDLYLPHEAVLRNGRTLPVYIDIHGGGFMYGYKELNRNFCTHLAALGFAVFSINYRLIPSTDFMGQLRDVTQALAWIKNHMRLFPLDPNSVFIIGDSAGGTLGLYALAIESSGGFAQALGLPRADLTPIGGAMISGLFDLTPYLKVTKGGYESLGSNTDSLMKVAPDFFAGFGQTAGAGMADPDTMAGMVDFPPIFLNTSSDDFLQGDALAMGLALQRHGRVFELHDPRPFKGQTLGHVYPVGMSWLDESRETLRQIHDFSYELL
ncbi:alpha/beta hydrolase [Bifidobacterium indicum]|uniref:alpha/beta hydrolase n=1 Tax=Bifidobacterium indicum TaxID=1691 RepID=UPI0030DD3DCA